ncbi:MAG: hypothetical protein K2P58_05510 [Hyphomonadaceae bacterium]|nr:hypothetical protein [Hyphomonadaceae bacterium]
MRLPKLVVVGLVGLFGFAASIATAEEAGAPAYSAVDGVDLVDPNSMFEQERFEWRVDPARSTRFAGFDGPVRGRDEAGQYRYELSVIARASDDLGLTFAPRAGLTVDRDGDISGRSSGAELRLGRVLSNRDNERSSEPTWYLFAASEDEALTWRPGARNDFGGVSPSFGVEERVDIGDLQAGVSYERDGWQASLAYVEREYSIRSGSRTHRHEESFTGVTWTMRH